MSDWVFVFSFASFVILLMLLSAAVIIIQQSGHARQSSNAQLHDTQAAFDRRLADLTQQVNQRLAEMNTQLQQQLSESRRQSGESTQSMLHRMDATGKLFAQLTEQYGSLQESSKRLAELGGDIGRLHQILAPSGPRGQFGELLLEEMLRNVLPAGAYVMQHGFKGGETVDAVIRLAHGMVCIDSKFPLPAFERFVTAKDADTRKAARKAFVRDCRQRIDEVAGKYIRPDEGTLDFALMYIPAENVYYETIIAHDDLGETESIARHAAGKRVICVSPNTLLAYLHVILIGLNGLRVEQNAREILGALSRISDELGRFAEEFRLTGTHLDRATSKFTDAERQLDKITVQIEQAASLGNETRP